MGCLVVVAVKGCLVVVVVGKAGTVARISGSTVVNVMKAGISVGYAVKEVQW